MSALSIATTSNRYLQNLTHHEISPDSWFRNILAQVDQVLQLMKVFDKTIVLKSVDLSLTKIHLERQALRLMKAFGALLGISLGTLILLSMGLSHLIILLLVNFVTGLAGWLLPELYIQDRVSTHQFLVYQAVPTFLEQLHMLTSSAGYESFPQALKLIAPSFPGTLGEELQRLVQIQPYLTENELLDRLTAICPHPLLKELAISIRVSTQYGTSLTTKTEHLVEAAQLQREQLTKEVANKTSGVLLGPLLLFHLPALLIIFLIPFLFVLQKGI